MSTLSTTNLKNPSSGSNNIVLATDGSTTITTLSGTTITGTSVRGVITSGTAVDSTSGTSIDFTAIPNWVKRVTVMFNGVSTSGTSRLLIQLGDSGGIETTGYNCGTFYGGSTAVNSAASTAGFILEVNAAAGAHYGPIQFSYFGSNSWHGSGWVKTNTNTYASTMGEKTLSDTLDRIRITTVSGTDTFDAGSINILYEG